jgi:hypothetical protein
MGREDMRIKYLLGLLGVFVILAAACGDDSDSSSGGSGDDAPNEDAGSGGEATDDGSLGSDSNDGASEDVPAVGSGGGASSLMFDGEEIALDARGCFAERQEVAGSIITLSAQASGTNAAGEGIIVDFTRFAPGGTVAEGDDILIDIGPLGETRTYQANLPFESVPIDSGVLTVAETMFTSFDGLSDVTVSVLIAC